MPPDISQTVNIERVIRPRHGLAALDWKELWRYRELFLLLSWRNILIRYKQTYLGVAWALLQPVLTVVIFTFIFGRLAKFSSGTVPYPVFALAAIVPWQFFANALSESSNSLLASQGMITKIYFPRLIIPASSILSGGVDLLVSIVLLGVLMVYYGVSVSPYIFLLPLFLLLTFITTSAVGVWFSALNVKYRDVKYVVPFIVRVGMYITPIGFMSSVVPEKWRLLYYSTNPMVGVIDGFRWCIFGAEFEPYWPGFFSGLGITFFLLLSGAYFFRSTEKTFADVI